MAAAASLALGGVALAAHTTTVKAASGPLSASLTASTHNPKLNVKMPISVTATLHGKPAHASAKYEFLFSGAVVSTQYVSHNKHFTFTGHYADTLIFPSQALGEPLTLRVVINSDGHTVNLNWAITPVS
ncbi:MAG: hypothetical protein ABSG64_05390 [Solirubrobacteraceae bacterium]|jgi:hypothetical protein